MKCFEWIKTVLSPKKNPNRNSSKDTSEKTKTAAPTSLPKTIEKKVNFENVEDFQVPKIVIFNDSKDEISLKDAVLGGTSGISEAVEGVPATLPTVVEGVPATLPAVVEEVPLVVKEGVVSEVIEKVETEINAVAESLPNADVITKNTLPAEPVQVAETFTNTDAAVEIIETTVKKMQFEPVIIKETEVIHEMAKEEVATQVVVQSESSEIATIPVQDNDSEPQNILANEPEAVNLETPQAQVKASDNTEIFTTEPIAEHDSQKEEGNQHAQDNQNAETSINEAIMEQDSSNEDGNQKSLLEMQDRSFKSSAETLLAEDSSVPQKEFMNFNHEETLRLLKEMQQKIEQESVFSKITEAVKAGMLQTPEAKDANSIKLDEQEKKKLKNKKRAEMRKKKKQMEKV